MPVRVECDRVIVRAYVLHECFQTGATKAAFRVGDKYAVVTLAGAHERQFGEAHLYALIDRAVHAFLTKMVNLGEKVTPEMRSDATEALAKVVATSYARVIAQQRIVDDERAKALKELHISMQSTEAEFDEMYSKPLK